MRAPIRNWHEISPGVIAFEDSCVVYALRGSTGYVLVNAGSEGGNGNLIAGLPGKATAVLLTHSFRDAVAGTNLLKEKTGAKVYAPKGEAFYLSDAEQHWRERNTWHLFDARWDRFAPRQSIEVDTYLDDYSTVEIDGLKFSVLPTPGMTPGAVSFQTTLNGMVLTFVGDLLKSGPSFHRVAPLQCDYNDSVGMRTVFWSLLQLEKTSVGTLYPAHGTPIVDGLGACRELREKVEQYYTFHRAGDSALEVLQSPEVIEFKSGIFRSKASASETYILIGESGKQVVIDYGWHSRVLTPLVGDLSSRKFYLHTIPELEKITGRPGLDLVILTHQHDDHVAGVPTLQRLYGAKCVASNCVADILRNPSRFNTQCLYPESIVVDSKDPGIWHSYDGIEYKFVEISGHSRFASIVLLRHREVAIAHIGDAFFWRGEKGFDYGPNANFFSNHVYQNGADRGCYLNIARVLEEFKPDWILTGHSNPYQPDNVFYEKLMAGAQKWEDLHQMLLSADSNESPMPYSGELAVINPYRIIAKSGELFSVTVSIPNQSSDPILAQGCLCLPPNWIAEPGQVTIPAHSIGQMEFLVSVPKGTKVRRQAITVELNLNGQPYGEVAEAIVSVDSPQF